MLDIMHTDVMPVCTKLNERDMQKGKIKCPPITCIARIGFP